MEQNRLLLLFLGIVSRSCLGHDCITERTTISRLKEDVFCGYDADLRPVKHHTNKTLVSLALFPRHLDFEEDRNSLYVGTWIYMTWMDASLAWSPKDYDNIEFLHVPPNMVWVPDISVYNKLDFDLDTQSQPAVVVSTGRVYTVVMSDFTAYCSMDLTYWPYDEHTCSAMLGSRSYTGSYLDFVFNKNTAVNMVHYLANKQWQLKSVNATRKVTNFINKNTSVYLVTVEYQFIVKRHATFVISTVFIPVLLLSLLVLLPMVVPLSSERCYNTLALSAIGHVAYLQYLGSIVSHNADNSILIVSYVRDSLIMTIFALIICIWVDKVTCTEPLPILLCNLLKNLEAARYTRMIFIPQNNFKQKNEEDVNLVNPTANIGNDWSTLVFVIQRLIFIIYLIVYFAMLIAFF